MTHTLAMGTAVAMIGGVLCVTLGPAPAQAFWSRGQVSMCADATTERERIRHRCHELGGYADPGWPALGQGGGGGRYQVPHPRLPPGHRPPTRRLG